MGNNVMVIAGVYNARGEIKDSDYKDYPFYTRYLDAVAVAQSGKTDFNTVTQNFTHTMLIEVATDTK